MQDSFLSCLFSNNYHAGDRIAISRAESYQKICHSQYRLDAFPALVEFAKSCVKNGVACRFSVVDCIGAEAVESCRRLAESEGVPLYVRKYIADS